MNMRAAAPAIAPLLALALNGCITALAPASLDVSHGPAASPPIEGAIDSAERERLRGAFQRNIYGFLPDRSETRITGRQLVDPEAFEGRGSFETIEVQLSASFDEHAVDTDIFIVDLVLPNQRAAPAGVIMMQTFCPRTDAVPHPAVSGGGPGITCNGGPVSWLMRRLFGRVVARPPMEALLDRGYAIASIYSRDIVPDHPRAGLDVLNELAPERAESDDRWGAIAAWGWIYARLTDVLSQDDRIDPQRMIAFGHSRFGKAALFAAAFDPRIDAVIANQSGLAGASLTRGKVGETLSEITHRYPHWFATAFDNFIGRENALPVDQHELLALIAPRPIFLGNARNDTWSDPNGAFRAAQGADPAYEALGLQGLDQAGMEAFNPSADIAYWLRPGFHGVEDEDWEAIFAFLDAHFPAR